MLEARQLISRGLLNDIWGRRCRRRIGSHETRSGAYMVGILLSMIGVMLDALRLPGHDQDRVLRV